jgi:hypothetical protein
MSSIRKEKSCVFYEISDIEISVPISRIQWLRNYGGTTYVTFRTMTHPRGYFRYRIVQLAYRPIFG